MHMHEQFLKMSIGLGLVFVLLYVFFRFSVDNFVLVFAFVALGLVSSVLRQEIGWEERLQNDQFCVECDVKP